VKKKKLRKYLIKKWEYQNIPSNEFKTIKVQTGFIVRTADMEKHEFIGEELEVIF
jgi:hypothetical protein